jgi:hypothetical protein
MNLYIRPNWNQYTATFRNCQCDYNNSKCPHFMTFSGSTRKCAVSQVYPPDWEIACWKCNNKLSSLEMSRNRKRIRTEDGDGSIGLTWGGNAGNVGEDEPVTAVQGCTKQSTLPFPLSHPSFPLAHLAEPAVRVMTSRVQFLNYHDNLGEKRDPAFTSTQQKHWHAVSIRADRNWLGYLRLKKHTNSRLRPKTSGQ